MADSKTPASKKLAQEIYDEFLICQICLSPYRTPKSLLCLHTFCEGCIESHVLSESVYKKYSDYREFTCPMCRKRTQLPVGGVKKLPDNFLVSSLSEIVGRQRQWPSTGAGSSGGGSSRFVTCEICQKRVSCKQNEGVSKCLDCVKILCASCAQMHRETKVTKCHLLVDVEMEKNVRCKDHTDEPVRYYCTRCDSCVCVLCTFNQHHEHEIVEFEEAVESCKVRIEHLVEMCKERIATIDDRLESMSKCETMMEDLKRRIQEAASAYVEEVRTGETNLLEELRNIYGKECFGRIEGKENLATMVRNIRSTCDISEIILERRSLEILLLKKDVEAKLTSMNSVDVGDLPVVMTKVVDFIPGVVEFGYLRDRDRPLLSTMRIKKPVVPGLEMEVGKMEAAPELKEVEVQTEPDSSSGLELDPIKTEQGTMTEVEQLENKTDSGALPGPNANGKEALTQEETMELRRRRRLASGRSAHIATSANSVLWTK